MDRKLEGIPQLNFSDQTASPRWSKKLFPEEVFDEFREPYSGCQKVAIRVPLLARQKGIDDAPLARLLGDAENPAHTDWDDSSSHFKGKYINGPATLRFVKNTVAEICQMLARDPSEEDPLLLDVFPIATDDTHQGFLVD